jgi:hypothetical protein
MWRAERLLGELYSAIYRSERPAGRPLTPAERDEILFERKGCEALAQKDTCDSKKNRCLWTGKTCKEKSTFLPSDCHLLDQHPCQEMANICQYVPPRLGSEGHCEAITAEESAESMYDTCMTILKEQNRTTLPTWFEIDRRSTELQYWAKTARDRPENAPILECTHTHVPPTVRLCSIVFNRKPLPLVEFFDGSSTTDGVVLTRKELDVWWETNAPKDDTTIEIHVHPL